MSSSPLHATIFEHAQNARRRANDTTTAIRADNSDQRPLTVADKARMLEEKREELGMILDTSQFFLTGERDVAEIVHNLVIQLHDLRAECPAEIWKELVPEAQAHSISGLLHQDPFTSRSFRKPRGYSGDGKLLDLLYRHDATMPTVRASTALGQEIYAYTSVSSSSRAVQERRALLAELVDVTAERSDGAEILAVAGGHLREAQLSKALAEGRLKRWTSLDQDEANLSEVAQSLAGTVVELKSGSVKALAEGAYDLGTYDLIYSAGVYDYLPFNISVGLSQILMSMIKPGGALFFANFSTEVVPAAYMETFMNWPLILRSETEMRRMAKAITARADADAEVFFGENRHIIYTKITKKG